MKVTDFLAADMVVAELVADTALVAERQRAEYGVDRTLAREHLDDTTGVVPVGDRAVDDAAEEGSDRQAEEQL